MKEYKISSKLVKAYADIQAGVVSSGREIDQEFIRRGFVSIQAEIDIFVTLFGVESYEVFLESQSDSEAFERIRTHDSEMHARLGAAESASQADLDALWSEVIDDPYLSCFSKRNMLKRYFSDRAESLFEPYVTHMQTAQQKERANLCRIFPEPATCLLEKDAVLKRKEIYNEVAADAYGELGFSLFRKNRGLHTYAKTLSKDLAIVIEPDAASLERWLAGAWRSPTAYWPALVFDSVCYLGSAAKRNRRQHITFLPVSNCIADSRRSRYEDSSSLEVAIRADALWYELAIAPIEPFVREHGSI